MYTFFLSLNRGISDQKARFFRHQPRTRRNLEDNQRIEILMGNYSSGLWQNELDLVAVRIKIRNQGEERESESIYDKVQDRYWTGKSSARKFLFSSSSVFQASSASNSQQNTMMSPKRL